MPSLRERLAHAFRCCAPNPGRLLTDLAPLLDELAARVEALEAKADKETAT
jgi:hypothetical protein